MVQKKLNIDSIMEYIKSLKSVQWIQLLSDWKI